MQSDRFIDTFYRPFLHEKLSLRLSCKNFNAVTDWKRFVTTYCMKLIYISFSFLTIFINRLDTVYYRILPLRHVYTYTIFIRFG